MNRYGGELGLAMREAAARFREELSAGLRKRGLTLTTNEGSSLGEMISFLRAAPDRPFINSVFHPAFNSGIGSDGIWISIREQERCIGTIAARLFVTDSYLSLKRSRRLWADERFVKDLPPLAFSFPAAVPDIRGRIVHEGALWVDRQRRGLGLPYVLALAVRVEAFLRFDADWYTALMRRAATEGSSTPAYFEAAHLCFRGTLPGFHEEDEYFVAYASKEGVGRFFVRYNGEWPPLELHPKGE